MNYQTAITESGPDELLAKVSRRTLLGFGLVALSVTRSRKTRADAYQLFGVHSPQLQSRLRHWRNIAVGYVQQLATSQHPNVLRFRRRLSEIPSGLPPVQLFETINKVVNAAAPYKSDYQSSLVRDHWATPMEFLHRGGDCEDFALTKAATLNHLEWPLDKMYLAIGILNEPPAKAQGHAVLVTILGDTLDSHAVLSNGTDEVVTLQQHRSFRPHYAVDTLGIKMFVPAKPAP